VTDLDPRPGPDDPLAFAYGCLNALVIMACLAGAVFLIVLALTR
jgi:hypothetical protein